jgi:hypothetical protein
MHDEHCQSLRICALLKNSTVVLDLKANSAEQIAAMQAAAKKARSGRNQTFWITKPSNQVDRSLFELNVLVRWFYDHSDVNRPPIGP